MNDTIKVQLGHFITTADTDLEVSQGTYRGFAIREFVAVNKFFEADPDYCPDPDNFCTGPRGAWKLHAEHLYRAVRIKTGEEFARGRTPGECTEQIDLALGANRHNLAIPF